MGSLLLLALLAPAAHAACGDLDSLVSTAERAAAEGRFDAVAVAVEGARAALGCGPLADPDLLARLWLADGVRAANMGDTRLASLSFAAAARTAPRTWNEAYDPRMRALYDAARAEFHGTGQVRVQPIPDGFVAAMDGLPMRFPADVPEGLHVVQVGPVPDRMIYATAFYLPPADTYFVLTGLEATVAAAPPPPVPAAPPVPAVSPSTGPAPAVAVRPAPLPEAPGASRHPAFLTAGGVAAAVAVGAALLAVNQDAAMEEAETLDALDAAFQRQRAWAWTSYGCMGLTAVGVGLYFAL